MQSTNGEDFPKPFRREQQWEVVRALLQRDNVSSQARQAFRRTYPDAPEEMLNAAVFHTYVEGIGAVIDWLVELEIFLRDSGHELDSGKTSHVLYHLYNWYQLAPLLVGSRTQVLQHLQEIKELVSDGDLQGILTTVAELESMFEGGQNFLDQ